MALVIRFEQLVKGGVLKDPADISPHQPDEGDSDHGFAAAGSGDPG